MRAFFLVLSGVAVIALAFWAYRENYATQTALRQSGQLAREIGRLREAIAVQRAEWAYLNRPDRLAELAATNFDRLGLLPMVPEQFADTRALPMPPAPAPDEITGLVDTVALFDELAP